MSKSKKKAEDVPSKDIYGDENAEMVEETDENDLEDEEELDDQGDDDDDLLEIEAVKAAMRSKGVTSAEFGEAINSAPIVIVDFWADWCGPCLGLAMLMEKEFEPFLEEHPIARYITVDCDQEQGLARAGKIEGIPAIMVFLGGKKMMFNLDNRDGDMVETDKFEGYDAQIPEILKEIILDYEKDEKKAKTKPNTAKKGSKPSKAPKASTPKKKGTKAKKPVK